MATILLKKKKGLKGYVWVGKTLLPSFCGFRVHLLRRFALGGWSFDPAFAFRVSC